MTAETVWSAIGQLKSFLKGKSTIFICVNGVSIWWTLMTLRTRLIISITMKGRSMNNIPTPSGYDVYWEKWVDAYSQDEDFSEIVQDLAGEEEPDLSFEEQQQLEQQIEQQFKSYRNIQTIFTPYGVLPLTEQSLASSYFKFWVGHTNFRITKSFVDIVSYVDGVESVDVFSPYRFRIGIATLFKDRVVMSEIRENMVGYMRELKNVSDETEDSRSS